VEDDNGINTKELTWIYVHVVRLGLHFGVPEMKSFLNLCTQTTSSTLIPYLVHQQIYYNGKDQEERRCRSVRDVTRFKRHS
jgi:hypothetical protein